MKYNFTKLADNQKKLDKTILDNVSDGISENEYWSKRIIAFLIELNEFSNEVKFFKYWKKNKNIDNKKVREELVDCLHFLFSIGNTINYKKWEIEINDVKESIDELYFEITKHTLKLNNSKKSKDFNNVFNYFMKYANKLNFSNEQLQEEYKLKNKINFERQENNY